VIGRRALALALLLAPSCSPRHRARPVDVVFWQRWPVEALEPYARRFEADNPGIHVVVERLPERGATDSLAQAIAAGRPPDLCELDRAQAARFMTEGALSDWSAGVADLTAGLRGWELCRLGDALYGLPWLLSTRVLLFNRQLLARAGLDSTRAPETWAELRSAALRLQRPGQGVRGYGLASGRGERFAAFMPYAWGAGGEMFSARLDSCRFDSPENVRALAFLISLEPASLVASEDSLAREFAAGRLGFLLADQGLALDLARGSAALRRGVGLVPRPSADSGAHVSIGTGSVLASFARSRRKEEALRFARFLLQPRNALGLAASLERVLPSLVSAADSAEYRERAEARYLLEQLRASRFAPIHRDGLEMEAAVDSLVGDALQHRTTPRHAVEDADSLIRALGMGR